MFLKYFLRLLNLNIYIDPNKLFFNQLLKVQRRDSSV